MKHILFIAADADSLINFRLPLIKKILSRGHLVSVASPINKSSKFLQKKLQDIGVSFHIFKVSRTDLNLFKNFAYKPIKMNGMRQLLLVGQQEKHSKQKDYFLLLFILALHKAEIMY